MPDYLIPLLIALASGGLFTGAAALFNSRNSAHKDEMVSLRETIKTLQDENLRLKTTFEEIASENIYYRQWSERLCYQVISLGAVPCTIADPKKNRSAAYARTRKDNPDPITKP